MTETLYCQRAIEGESPCVERCDHCKLYFEKLYQSGQQKYLDLEGDSIDMFADLVNQMKQEGLI